MSDTPETDAVYKVHPCDIYDYIPLEFARKMERERNEARKEINSLFGALAATQDAIGCGCGGDYGLCDDCSEAYNKTDELIKARETKPNA